MPPMRQSFIYLLERAFARCLYFIPLHFSTEDDYDDFRDKMPCLIEKDIMLPSF